MIFLLDLQRFLLGKLIIIYLSIKLFLQNHLYYFFYTHANLYPVQLPQVHFVIILSHNMAKHANN